MPIKVEGLSELESQLNLRFGRAHTTRWIDKALIAGSKVFIKYLRDNFDEFADTGYSRDEITASNPMWLNGKRTIKIHWRGPHNRFRIIHLNEFGTIKNPNPKGKGAVERALRAAQNEYYDVLNKEISRYVR